MSITGQTGHIAIAKQTAFGTPNTTAANYKAVKITGDSLVASNNMLVAEGEIGLGRDVSQAVPGGFSVAGAVNGTLRARSAAIFLQGALGSITAVTGPPAVDELDVADVLPVYTIEKKVGSAVRDPNELLTVRISDAMVNTLNISAPSGALATFSAGLVAAGEQTIAAPLVDPVAGTPAAAAYTADSDDLLVFHGGRIRTGPSADGGAETLARDDTFQSMEVVINNNVAADEWTVRPSRFLRSLTEGIRSVEANMTIVFEDYEKYQQYTYGAQGRNTPGYNLYMGALEFFLGNWQIADVDDVATVAPTGAPANPQAVQIHIPKLAFSGFPVSLATGRIAVTTTARALKPTTGPIIDAVVRPSAAGF